MPGVDGYPAGSGACRARLRDPPCLKPQTPHHLTAMTTIAVMQPYFFPYLGHFRLLSSVDIFVHFDCVQFPRRGYVHRNQMPKYPPAGTEQQKYWLTLPLAAQAQDVRIADLAFAPDAATE